MTTNTNSRCRSSRSSTIPTTASLQLHDHDILCGKDKVAAMHPGSVQFRLVMERYVERYERAETKYDKMTLTRDIQGMFLRENIRFLKWNSTLQHYEELTTAACRDKIGHSLRHCALRTNKHKKGQKPPLVSLSCLKKQTHNDEGEKKLFPSLAIVEQPKSTAVVEESNGHLQPTRTSSTEYNNQFSDMNLDMLMNEPIGAIADTDSAAGDNDDVTDSNDGNFCSDDNSVVPFSSKNKSGARVQELLCLLSSFSASHSPAITMGAHDNNNMYNSSCSNPFEQALDLAQQFMDIMELTHTDTASGTAATMPWCPR